MCENILLSDASQFSDELLILLMCGGLGVPAVGGFRLMSWPEKKERLLMNYIFLLIELKVLNSCWFEENKESGSYLGASKWSETEGEHRSFRQTGEKQRSALPSICFEPKNTDSYLIVQDQVVFSFLGWPAPQDNVLAMVVSDIWISAGEETPSEETLQKKGRC